MPRKFDLSGLTTIGIDPGKNSLHLIGLDSWTRCETSARTLRQAFPASA